MEKKIGGKFWREKKLENKFSPKNFSKKNFPQKISQKKISPKKFPKTNFPGKKISEKKFLKKNSNKKFLNKKIPRIFFGWAQRSPPLGPKGPTVAAEDSQPSAGARKMPPVGRPLFLV